MTGKRIFKNKYFLTKKITQIPTSLSQQGKLKISIYIKNFY